MNIGILTLAITGLVAFALSVVLTAWCKALAYRRNAISVPRDDRWRRESVPLLGREKLTPAV